MILETPRAPAAALRRNLLIRFLSSIWLGIALLTIILVYSSLVSALPPIRWALEMTEMQAFKHSFFVAVSLLFMAALVVTTVVRTRWNWLNMGSILAHAGLLLLLGGALVYFGTKIEGDVLVQAPAVQIRAVSGGNTVLAENIPAVRGETWRRFLPFLGGHLELGVVDTQSQAEFAVVAAHVAFRVGDQPAQTVHLSAADPNWTSLHPSLQVRLNVFPPQRHFYNNERPAVYVRNLTTGRERMIEIRALPIYGERYTPEDGLLRDSRGREIASKRARPELRLGALAVPTGWFERWTMPIDVPTGDLPFDIDITGYVPYVVNVRQVPGQNGTIREEPVLAVRGERRMDQSVRAMSAVRMRFTGRGAASNWAQTNWVLFSQYPDIDARPLRVSLPGASDVWEIVYSRVRHDLGASITARDLDVQFFPGERGIKSWHSDILIAPHDGKRDPYAAIVETNNTQKVGPWTLFQSGFAQDHWSYTVLGVGNRLGIAPMMVGWIVVTIGCLYAFYVKPLLLRRARLAGRQRGALASRVEDETAVDEPALEPQFADSLRG